MRLPCLRTITPYMNDTLSIPHGTVEENEGSMLEMNPMSEQAPVLPSRPSSSETPQPAEPQLPPEYPTVAVEQTEGSVSVVNPIFQFPPIDLHSLNPSTYLSSIAIECCDS